MATAEGKEGQRGGSSAGDLVRSATQTLQDKTKKGLQANKRDADLAASLERALAFERKTQGGEGGSETKTIYLAVVDTSFLLRVDCRLFVYLVRTNNIRVQLPAIVAMELKHHVERGGVELREQAGAALELFQVEPHPTSLVYGKEWFEERRFDERATRVSDDKRKAFSQNTANDSLILDFALTLVPRLSKEERTGTKTFKVILCSNDSALIARAEKYEFAILRSTRLTISTYTDMYRCVQGIEPLPIKPTHQKPPVLATQTQAHTTPAMFMPASYPHPHPHPPPYMGPPMANTLAYLPYMAGPMVGPHPTAPYVGGVPFAIPPPFAVYGPGPAYVPAYPAHAAPFPHYGPDPGALRGQKHHQMQGGRGFQPGRPHVPDRVPPTAALSPTPLGVKPAPATIMQTTPQGGSQQRSSTGASKNTPAQTVEVVNEATRRRFETIFEEGKSSDIHTVICNDSGTYGSPLLHLACRYGQTSAVRNILNRCRTNDHRLQLLLQEQDGRIPIEVAVEGKRADDKLVQELLQSGFDLRARALHTDVDMPWWVYLIGLGPTPSVQMLLATTAARLDHKGASNALHVLAKMPSHAHLYTCFVSLHTYPAMLAQKDKTGKTPLRIAIIKGSTAMVDHYRDMFTRDKGLDGEGNTPLHVALKGGDVDVAVRLVDDVYNKDINRACSREERVDTLNKLLHMENRMGETPRGLAVSLRKESLFDGSFARLHQDSQ
eukprot:comp22296_c1_seq1/m.33072 comp22296_c1_seq1/g.33072  ORF comp22296_c1_seq1/g.33072 comp22296_c1_seq1/m.33072 type:complete len:721 (-) comp22296_c1_seq1:402-2564(-)